MTLKFAPLSMLAVLALCACAADGGSSDDQTADDTSSETSDAGSCDALTYASFGETFLSNYCVSCHGPTMAQKNIRLDSLAGLTAAKAKVKSEVSGGAMPPRGSKAPSSQERAELGQWINCGAK